MVDADSLAQHLNFLDLDHTVNGFELLDTDCLVVLNSGAGEAKRIASIELYHITVDMHGRATFTCTAIFQLPAVQSSIIRNTSLGFATRQGSHVFPHSPDAPHTTDASATRSKPFCLMNSNHVLSISWSLFHRKRDFKSPFLIFIRASFFMDAAKASEKRIPEVRPWGLWGPTNSRMLVDDERFDRDRNHRTRGPRFLHLGLITDEVPVYATILDFGRFAPKKRWNHIEDAMVTKYVSDPRFPWNFGREFPFNTWFYDKVRRGYQEAQNAD